MFVLQKDFEEGKHFDTEVMVALLNVYIINVNAMNFGFIFSHWFFGILQVG